MSSPTELADGRPPPSSVVGSEPPRSGGGSPWWERTDRLVGLLVVAACVAFVFVQLEPSLLLRNTTAAGGDTIAHNWWPAYLRDHLLPWRLSGWSPDFYAGFPAGQYYFPFPALFVIALDALLPYNVAFKLVTALGPMLLPVGAYVFGRGIRAPRPAPAAFAVAATAFVFWTGDPGTSSISTGIASNQHIAGGTLASTLAGEFSYTIALALALMFLGTLAMSLQTRRRLWLPAVLLAATVMSHLVVAIFAALGAFVVWLAYRPGRNVGRVAAIGGVGGLLTAVWSVPLVATLAYTTDMRYSAITQYRLFLFPKYLWGIEGIAPWDWGATVFTGIALAAVAMRRGRRMTPTLVLVTLTALCGVLFGFWENLQSTTVWNLRFIPFWYLCLFLVIGLGVAETIRGVAWLVRRLSVYGEAGWSAPVERALVIGLLTVAVTLGALASLDSNKGFLPYWIRWNYRGVEDASGTGATAPKQYREYSAFINAANKLPPGRLLWEGNSQLNVYGSSLALMLLPYFTHGRIASMEGVYFEASATTPYHFMTVAALVTPGNASNAVVGVPYRSQTDFKLGVRWLQLLGVRYLALHSVEAKAKADADPRLRLAATSPDVDGAPPLGWHIYQVSGSTLVTPLRYRPVVVDHVAPSDEAICRQREAALLGSTENLKVHDWQDCIAVPWFNDPHALDRPLVAEGPSSWQHAGPVAALKLPKERLPRVRVTDVHAGDDSVSFDVSRTGVPVYVKTSFFPNWEAQGADGPYRSTPNLMVVVPTSHHVTLRYGTTSAEWLGRTGTVAGFAGLVALVAIPRRRRRRTMTEAAAGAPPPA